MSDEDDNDWWSYDRRSSELRWFWKSIWNHRGDLFRQRLHGNSPVRISIPPENGYGAHNPEAVQEVTKDNFPADFEFEEGRVVQGTVQNGQPFIATILEEQNETVKLDFNHPMAGKDLNFEIELVSIE